MISPYHGLRVIIKKSVSFGIYSSGQDEGESEGREQIKSAKTNDLFDLAVANSKSNSWRITTHFEYLPPAIVETIYRSWGCNQKL